MANLSTFTDSFADLSAWTLFTAGDAIAQGGQAVCKTGLLTAGATLTDVTYTLDSIYWRSFPDEGNTTGLYDFFFESATGEGVEVQKTGTALNFNRYNGGGTTLVATTTYSDSSHAWFKMEISGANFVLSGSPDGATWTSIGSVATATVGWNGTGAVVGFYSTDAPTPAPYRIASVNTTVVPPVSMVKRLGTNNSVASGTTIDVTYTGTLKPQIGDLIVVSCARNDIASDPLTGDSISADPGSNTYTRVVAGALATAGTANDGAVVVKFYSILTAAWPGGSNTLTWTHPTTTARAVQVNWYAKGTGYTLGFVASSSATATSTTNAASVATGGTLAAGDLVVGTGAVEHATAETGDADTTNGTWTPVSTVITTGTTNAAMQSVEQHKWVTATGNQTWNPTGASSDAALAVAAWRATLVPATTPPPPRRLALPMAILGR